MRTFSPRQQALILAAVFFATAIVATRTAAQTAWRQLDGPTGGAVTELVAAPDGSIFAITATSLLRSTDRGASWQHADRGLPRYIALWLLPTRTGTLLAAVQGTGGSHLYRSTDLGATWTESTIGLPETYTFSIAPLALDVNGDVFVAHTKFIFRSTDDGATWLSTAATSAGRDLHALDGDLYVIGSRGITHLDGDDAMRERVIPVPQGLLAYWMMLGPGARITAHLQADQTFGYYRTDDSGRTWTRLNLPEAWLRRLRRDRSGGTSRRRRMAASLNRRRRHMEHDHPHRHRRGHARRRRGERRHDPRRACRGNGALDRRGHIVAGREPWIRREKVPPRQRSS